MDLYAPDSEALRVTLAIFDRFVADVRADGSTPIVLLFPQHDDIRRFHRTGKRIYQPVIDHLAGTATIDLLAAFDGCDDRCLEGLHAPEGHYSAAGNARVAAYLAGALPVLFPPTGPGPAAGSQLPVPTHP